MRKDIFFTYFLSIFTVILMPKVMLHEVHVYELNNTFTITLPMDDSEVSEFQLVGDEEGYPYEDNFIVEEVELSNHIEE